MSGRFPTLNYWCVVSVDLHEIARLLTPVFNFNLCEFDAEDLYEWFETADSLGRAWNVSRKHRGGESAFDDRLRIVISPVPEDEDKVGRVLAETLKSPVIFGEVTYIKGDDYAYREQKRFEGGDKL